MWKYAGSEHFTHLKDFAAIAATKGGLPGYSFIEPIYFDSLVWGPENDMHPECNPYQFYGPSNLHRGECLLAKVYNAIRNSPDWESTLLIVLFDEHGGCYDHVPPPTADESSVAIAPDDKIIRAGESGGIGFKFDRLGPRVPAIVISAYTPPQTRLHAVFEHTSVLTTVVNCFALPKDKLGVRQSKALDVSAALSLPAPRNDHAPIAGPQSTVMEDVLAELHSIVHTRILDAKQGPVSDLHRTALHGAAIFTEASELHERIDNLQNELEADLLLAEHEAAFLKKSIL